MFRLVFLSFCIIERPRHSKKRKTQGHAVIPRNEGESVAGREETKKGDHAEKHTSHRGMKKGYSASRARPEKNHNQKRGPHETTKNMQCFLYKADLYTIREGAQGGEAHTQRKRVKRSGNGRPAYTRRADGEDIQLRRWPRVEGRETNLQFIRDTHA